MRKIVSAIILCLSLSVSGCTDKKVVSGTNPEAKSTEMKVHGGAATKDTAPAGLKDVVKTQILSTYPAATIGKAFDEYSYVTKKEWKETQAANGKVYVDFTGWFQSDFLGIDAIKKGISQQGIEIKFVINRDGAFFVGMVSKLEVKTDGKVYAYPLEDSKAVLDSIYTNKRISF